MRPGGAGKGEHNGGGYQDLGGRPGLRNEGRITEGPRSRAVHRRGGGGLWGRGPVTGIGDQSEPRTRWRRRPAGPRPPDHTVTGGAPSGCPNCGLLLLDRRGGRPPGGRPRGAWVPTHARAEG